MEKWLNKIHCGDALEILKKIPDECIDMVITSPPYWGLRNYGVEGQLGLEPTFEEFVKKFLEITAEIKRVLKKSGSFWMNFGDSYASIGKIEGDFTRDDNDPKWGKHDSNRGRSRIKKGFYPEKCLLMQPERIAIKLIDEQGFILRNKIKWCKQIYIAKERITKGSVMPSSVQDRFNESGEELYFFVKNKKYYSNLDAVRLPNQVLGITDFRASGLVRSAELYPNSKYAHADGQGKIDGRVNGHKRKQDNIPSRNATIYKGFNERWKNKTAKYNNPDYKLQNSATSIINRTWDKTGNLYNPKGKNLPTCWLIGAEPHNFQNEYEGINSDHFAIFPQKLLEIPIRFACLPDGIILDPFIGSGTTALAAKKLNRNYIGIEISEKYIKIAEKRLRQQTIWEKESEVN